MTFPPFVCPRCRGSLSRQPEAYRCGACAADYLVVAGIPDFRVFPDPWIGLEEDRAKALRVDEATRGLDFAAAVRAYWDMTPETPRALADRYVEHVTRAPQRSHEWLSRLAAHGAPPAGPWIDLGCGTGDLLAAATAYGIQAVGADIAFRWLVVARRRPELANAATPLACCCAEALPFPDDSFATVAALGLLEHCADPLPVVREARRVLRPGGRLVLRTANRYSLLPEPHVRVWGVGFVPRRWADRYVRWRSGMRYQHHRPVSVRELRGALRAAGFGSVAVGGAPVLPTERTQLSALGRTLAPLYGGLRRTPVIRGALAWVAPLLEASAEAA